MDLFADVVPNVLASAITAVLGFVLGVAPNYLRRRSVRRLLGLRSAGRPTCDIMVGYTPKDRSGIHKDDVAAMLEVASLVRRAGAVPRIVDPERPDMLDRDAVEFCLSGRDANARTGAHLDNRLPGLIMRAHNVENEPSMAIEAGGRLWVRKPGREEFAVLARVCRPGRPHVVIISGQTGITNRAAALFLSDRQRELQRRFGSMRPFCLILKVIDPVTYGYREVEEAADVSEAAFQRQ